MSVDSAIAKGYRQYQYISWGLNGVAGAIGLVNIYYTVIAYKDQGLGVAIPYLAAIAYSLIQAGAMCYILAPSVWGEAIEGIKGEAKEALNPFRGNSKVVAAIILAIVMLLLLSVTIGSIWADWLSTAQGLGLNLPKPQSEGFIAVLAWVLVLGSEVCTLFAHQISRLGKRHAIAQMAENATLDPALTYSKEHLRAAKAAAKAQAKAAGNHWGQPHSS